MNRSIALLCAASLTLPACNWYSVPEDDAGGEAFVRQAVPSLLGRKVRNHAELTVLADLHAESGAEAVVDVLMQDPDFATYWVQALVDALGVKRKGGAALDADCWSAPTDALIDEGLTDELVAHLRATESSSDPGSLRLELDEPFVDSDGDPLAFTLTDVLYAAVVEDALDVVHRAFVFPLGITATAETDKDGQYREDAAELFMDVFTDRSADCMGCHTGVYSKTDALSADSWDRHEALGVDIEGAVFHSGSRGDMDFAYGGMGSDASFDALGNFFRIAQFADTGDGDAAGSAPWGMDMSCVTNGNWEGFDSAVLAGTLGSDDQASFAGLVSDTAGIGELAHLFAEGVAALAANQADGVWPEGSSPWTGTDAATLSNYDRFNCDQCHHAGSSPTPDLADIATYYSDGVILEAITNPPAGMTVDELFDSTGDGADDRTPEQGLRDVVSWLTILGYTRPDQVAPADDGAEAYAWMVATQLVDDLVFEVWGNRLVLEHGFSRNPDQYFAHMALTSALVENDWSLRAVLKEMLLSEAFNRLAPADTDHDDVLPMVPAPYVEVEEPGEGDNTNGQGDLVTRFSIPNLLLSAGRALGWGPVDAFGNDDTFPTEDDFQELGRPLSGLDSGVDVPTLQTLWAWEQTPGSCWEHPIKRTHAQERGLLNDTWDALGLSGVCATGTAGVVSAECWDDWIDRLVAEVDRRAATPPPGDDATLEDVLLALRDRLLGDAVVDATEQGFLEDAYGTGAAFSDVFDGSSAVDEEALRAICGAMTKSPQFMLRHLPTGEPSVATELEVCMDGEECDQSALCADVSAAASVLGHTLTCP